MNDQIILITGTNSGFGWLIAKTCAAAGHKVYAGMRNTNGKNKEKAEELSQEKNITVLDIDVTETTSVETAVREILSNDGRIDVVVNNAGIYPTGIAETFTDKDLAAVLDVNLAGPWRVIKFVLPQMRTQQKGLIINISSISGRFSFPFQSMYNTSKFALEGLIEGLHYEVRKLGVDVVLLQPGAFPTEIFSKMIAGSDDQVAAQYGDLQKIPGQMGAGIGEMFASVKPDPQMIADSVLGLINLPQGKRPLRSVADAATGTIVKTANEQVEKQFAHFLTAFGMQEMLA